MSLPARRAMRRGQIRDWIALTVFSVWERQLNANQPQHSYEEIRDVVIYMMLNAPSTGVIKFDKLLDLTALALYKQDGAAQARRSFSHGSSTQLHPSDAQLVVEIVWDLFRQGVVTFGLDASNPGWPWLRLSRFGEIALQQNSCRFHDTAGFMKSLHSEVTDISPETYVYLEEAVAAFYSDCLLSTCVMLGAAAEIEFLRLLDVAKNSDTYGRYFSRIGDGLFIRTKISRFQEAVKPLLNFLPKSATNDLGLNLNTAQSVIGAARNESGQPSGANPPSRDHVYIYLQLFIPFAKQAMRLRHAFNEPVFPRFAGAPLPGLDAKNPTLDSRSVA